MLLSTCIRESEGAIGEGNPFSTSSVMPLMAFNGACRPMWREILNSSEY
jgi:hypothetical protein